MFYDERRGTLAFVSRKSTTSTLEPLFCITSMRVWRLTPMQERDFEYDDGDW
jgi:hypothetical protein